MTAITRPRYTPPRLVTWIAFCIVWGLIIFGCDYAMRHPQTPPPDGGEGMLIAAAFLNFLLPFAMMVSAVILVLRGDRKPPPRRTSDSNEQSQRSLP